MKIDRIHYEELFPTGIYANQRLRIEATVDESDNATECYQTLKTHVQKAFQALNPNLEEMKGTHVLKVPQEPPNMSDPELDAMQKDQALIDTINYCTTTRSVEMFKKEVERRNNPIITEAFENKLKSLQQ